MLHHFLLNVRLIKMENQALDGLQVWDKKEIQSGGGCIPEDITLPSFLNLLLFYTRFYCFTLVNDFLCFQERMSTGLQQQMEICTTQTVQQWWWQPCERLALLISNALWLYCILLCWGNMQLKITLFASFISFLPVWLLLRHTGGSGQQNHICYCTVVFCKTVPLTVPENGITLSVLSQTSQ